MREHNGLEIVKKLTLSSRAADIPLVFISGFIANEVQALYWQLGAIDDVLKPIRTSLFTRRIEAHLRYISDYSGRKTFALIDDLPVSYI